MTAPRFREVPGWSDQLPDVRAQDVSDIAVGPGDIVQLLYRDPASVVTCTAAGEPLRTFGADVMGPSPHGVTPGPDETTYVVDDGSHCVRLFDAGGRQVATFGTGPSNPEFARPIRGDYVSHIAMGFPPFTRPTRLALAPSGDRYVSDGYGNCRIHRFSAAHDLVSSWGEPGTQPGGFHIPHEVTVDRAGRVLVCDRENDRVQIFDAEGTFVGEWTELQRPQALAEGPDGLFYIGEGEWRTGHVSQRLGPVPESQSRITVVDRDGALVGRIGPRPEDGGTYFVAAHGLALDSRGDLYVSEVSYSVLRRFPAMGPRSHPAVRKFTRVD